MMPDQTLSKMVACQIQLIRIIGLSVSAILFLHFRNTSALYPHTMLLKSTHCIDIANYSVLFTISYIQDPILQFASPSGLKEYTPLWKSYFTTALEMTYFHYQDYSYAVNVSSKLDKKIEDDAYRVSKNNNYTAIVALSARQALGGIVFAESSPNQIRDGKGSKPLVFLKEISSDGNMQTVDVIFPA